MSNNVFMYCLGFDVETGRQVSILPLAKDVKVPQDHMQPGRNYGFYRGQPCMFQDQILLPAGDLMMQGAGPGQRILDGIVPDQVDV